MLWGNPAVVAGLLLGATFAQQGSKMQPGSVLSLGEMPFYYYTDADGDQTALPCTERMLSSKAAELVTKHLFIPLLSIKGRPEVRLAGFGSLAGGLLAGQWKPVTKSSSDTPPPSEPAKPEEESSETAEPTAEDAAAPAEALAAEETPAAEPAAENSGGDPELDKLLGSLNEESTPAAEQQNEATADNAEPEMDPDLANLLKELGS
jgi:type VI secretion system protein ImpC